MPTSANTTLIDIPLSKYFDLEDNAIFEKALLDTEKSSNCKRIDVPKNEHPSKLQSLSTAYIETHIDALIASGTAVPLSVSDIQNLIRANPHTMVPEVMNALLAKYLKQLLIDTITDRSLLDSPADFIEALASECLEALVIRGGKPISQTTVKILTEVGRGVIIPEVMNSVLCESTKTLLVERVLGNMAEEMSRIG